MDEDEPPAEKNNSGPRTPGRSYLKENCWSGHKKSISASGAGDCILFELEFSAAVRHRATHAHIPMLSFFN